VGAWIIASPHVGLIQERQWCGMSALAPKYRALPVKIISTFLLCDKTETGGFYNKEKLSQLFNLEIYTAILFWGFV
jgi:hypothetical protein